MFEPFSRFLRGCLELDLEDGTPADPPVLHTAVPNWQVGDTIPLGADRTLRVIEVSPGGQQPRASGRARLA